MSKAESILIAPLYKIFRRLEVNSIVSIRNRQQGKRKVVLTNHSEPKFVYAAASDGWMETSRLPRLNEGAVARWQTQVLSGSLG